MLQDDSKEMHIYHSIRAKKKTSEDVMSLVGDLKGDIKAFRGSYRRLEERVSAASQDIDAKFESLFSALKQMAPQVGDVPTPAVIAAPVASPIKSNWQPVGTATPIIIPNVQIRPTSGKY